MILFLTIVSGLAWSLVYIEAIRIGFRDRSYAIPAAALALNFAWEVIYASRSAVTGLSAQGVFNIVWALADVLVLYTFFRFGRSELPAWVTRKLFVGWGALLGIVAFAVQLLFMVEFGPQATRGHAATEHYHPFEEAYFLLSGSAIGTLDGEPVQVTAGDLVWTSVNGTHGFVNEGDVPVRWLEVQAPLPPASDAFFFPKDWEALP